MESDPNIPRGIKPQDLTEYQARVLLSASPEKRREIAAKIEAEGEVPSARRIESMVAEDASTVTPSAPEATPGSPTDLVPAPIEPSFEEASVSVKPSVENTITGVIGADLDEIRKLLVDEHGLTEQEADTALQGFKEAYPDIWDICYDDQDKPKLPHVPVTPEKRTKDEEDIQKYIEEHDLGWILRIPPTDINYKSHLPKLTDEELDFCLKHETRSTSLQRLRGEKLRRERAQQEQEIDQAVFTCNRCGKSFLIVHLEPSGRHKLKPVKEAEQ